MFTAGLESDPPRTILGSSLGRDDSKEESAEGFVLLVSIDESTLDSRDVGRVSVPENLVLVSIVDDNGTAGLSLCVHANMHVCLSCPLFFSESKMCAQYTK